MLNVREGKGIMNPESWNDESGSALLCAADADSGLGICESADVRVDLRQARANI